MPSEMDGYVMLWLDGTYSVVVAGTRLASGVTKDEALKIARGAADGRAWWAFSEAGGGYEPLTP